jgi:hypothetical protein
MTKQKFSKIMNRVKSISQDGPMDDEAAFNTAKFILMDNPGLKEYIQNTIGAFDALGWLANEI